MLPLLANYIEKSIRDYIVFIEYKQCCASLFFRKKKNILFFENMLSDKNENSSPIGLNDE